MTFRKVLSKIALPPRPTKLASCPGRFGSGIMFSTLTEIGLNRLTGMMLFGKQPVCPVASQGPLAAGWPTGAPYDVILIEGAVHSIPKAIGEQLHQETGRLVAVCTDGKGTSQAVLAEATVAGLRTQPMFDCATPAIPRLL